MPQILRAGIIGAGWPGTSHARGFSDAGGFKVAAVADLIPARRKKLMESSARAREYADGHELLADKEIDVVSICVPNNLHAPLAIAALKRGLHVCCEKPPAISAAEARKIEAAAKKSGKIVLYALQRRFGGAEQAAKAAIAKGYAGDVSHIRATWMRSRGVPVGTGWYSDKAKSGGGAMMDIGIHMLDLAWSLLGEPTPISAFAATHRMPDDASVETSAFAMLKFEGNRSLELAVSWMINQPPQQQGMLCRVYGAKAAIDVYTSHGASIYRNFDAKGASSPTALKPPKTTGHTALMRHFKQCIAGQAQPMVGAEQGVALMRMIDSIYKSAETGKSVEMKR